MLFAHREACQSEREGAGARAPEAAPGGAGQGSEGVGAAEAEGAGSGALAQGEVGALTTAEMWAGRSYTDGNWAGSGPEACPRGSEGSLHMELHV